MKAVNPTGGAENREQRAQPTPSQGAPSGLRAGCPRAREFTCPSPRLSFLPATRVARRRSTQQHPHPPQDPRGQLRVLRVVRGAGVGGGAEPGLLELAATDPGSGAPPGGEKEDKGAAAGFCTGSRIIHFSNRARETRHRGNSAGATGRIRDRELGFGINLTKCIKNLCFSTITKKPKATRAVVYTKHGDIASLANRFLTRQGDKTERRAQGGGGGWRARRVQKGG